MFHVKQRRSLGLVVLVALAGLTLGCLGQVGSRGWAAPVLTQDVVIVSTQGGKLDAIDSEGAVIWKFPELWAIPDKAAEDLDGIYGAPQVGSYDGEDVVFVGDYNGFVYAFRPGDFEPGVTISQPEAASFELNGSVAGGMLLDMDADALYVTSGSRLYSLRASDLVARIDNPDAPVGAAAPAPAGKSPGVLFEADEDLWAAPVLADGRVLVTSLDGGLYAIDPATAEIEWSFKAEQGLASAATVVGNVVLVSGFGSKLFAVDLADGSLRWAFEAKNWIWGDALVDGDVIYVADFDSVVHALALDSGTQMWSLELDRGPLRASPALADGTLVVSSDEGWLVGVDLAAREVAWERDIGTSMNADMRVEDGQVLIAPDDCVRPENATEDIYYTSVDPRTGDLTFTAGVC